MTVALVLTLSGTAFPGWLMADPAPAARLPARLQIVAPRMGGGRWP
jgi:hypothetical protein